MSSRMYRGNKISLTLFGASSPDYHPCYIIMLFELFFVFIFNSKYIKGVKKVRSAVHNMV